MVQGVGYRYFAQRRGRELGLVGFVRNEDDGSVLVEAQGEPPSLDAYIEALKQGPASARVREVIVTDIPIYDDRDFRVTY